MAGNSKDRVPPHNDDAEKAVIGAMLIDENAVISVQQYLRQEDFYSSRHQKIFDALIKLINKGTRPDLITLSEELDKMGILDKAGGYDYLASLTDAVLSSANAEYYAQIVQDCSLRRGLIEISGETASPQAESPSEEAAVEQIPEAEVQAGEDPDGTSTEVSEE